MQATTNAERRIAWRLIFECYTQPVSPAFESRYLVAVALISSTLLMIELALTRIFSVIMYYHFAFLAISIALFGISASGVLAYVARRRLERIGTASLLATESIIYAVVTIVALFFLVRLRVGLQYSPHNLVLMLTIYALAALPFLTGGLVITIAVSRLTSRINAVYAADLIGAATGCLVLIPLLDRFGAPGVVLVAGALSVTAAVIFADRAHRTRYLVAAAAVIAPVVSSQLVGANAFDVLDTKGHQGDRVLFSKWNSFSRIGVYERSHGDWSLSPSYTGPLPETRFMDIDSAASTPILRLAPDLSNAQYLRYELTALAYQLKDGTDFSALIIGPGGGRDLASALVFGAKRVDGVEINPIIADEVMRDRFSDFSGRIYSNPRIRIAVDDGRSFVRRATGRYDVIQASLVDTWAATTAGAYTLTENTLYTVEAFDDYLDHLTDNGVLSITRWVLDGLRLVSLAQEACSQRGWSCADRLAIVRQDRVATFLLKRSPFTETEIAKLRETAHRLDFDVLYAPSTRPGGVISAIRDEWVDGQPTGDYARLIRTDDREAFYARYRYDIRPTTDDRPFFFNTTKLKDQFHVAFGRSMLFGNGLSALLTLLAISVGFIVLFVVGPLAVTERGNPRPPGWLAWLFYFGALGAGFMLIEVSVLQRFVLLLGHPVYSLTVTLFSLLLGSGLGAAWSRRFDERRLSRDAAVGVVVVAVCALAVIAVAGPVVSWAIPFSRGARIVLAAALLVPIGVALGIPMPTGIRMLNASSPEMVPWAWGINGALSVLGATLAILIAMNWGFRVTLVAAAGTYLLGLAALKLAVRHQPIAAHASV
jgi:predicted membrane-bound spermidine synthase